MVLKMSKKTVPLPQRPGPPSVEQIVEDVQSTKEHDIIYLVDLNQTSHPESPGLAGESYSFEDSSPKLASLNDSNPSESQESESAVDTEGIYQKAMQFIEVTEQLKKATEVLKCKSEDLQILGKEMTDSIDALKQQAETVLNQSLSKS